MKYLAVVDWSWNDIAVKAGQEVPVERIPADKRDDLVRTLLGIGNIMPAETKAPKPPPKPE